MERARSPEGTGRVVPLGAPGFEGVGGGAKPSRGPVAAGRRDGPPDAPGPGWWARRRCRRAGMGLVLLSLILFGISLEGGVDGAAALLGRPPAGGELTASAGCGLGFGDAELNSCRGGNLTVSTLDGQVLAREPLTPWGGTIHFDQVPSSLVRIRAETSRGAWERQAYVPDGSSVRVELILHDPFADVFPDRDGGDGLSSPRSAPGWEGESPRMHALGLVAAPLAAAGAYGGWCATVMRRFRWAAAGAAAASLAGFLVAPLNPLFALFGFLALADFLFIGMAQGQFGRKAPFEPTVLLD